MKKIIFLFLVFSGVVFAESEETFQKWEYSIHHNSYGVTFHDFTIHGIVTSSQLSISITTDIDSGYSSVTLFNEQIKSRNKYSLLLTSDADSYSYDIFKKDIENGAIRVENTDGRQRGNNLTKILVSVNIVGLYDDKMENVLDIFILKDLKETIKQKLGNSDWYKYKINE